MNVTFLVQLEFADLVMCYVLCTDGFGVDLAGRVAMFWSARGPKHGIGMMKYSNTL